MGAGRRTQHKQGLIIRMIIVKNLVDRNSDPVNCGESMDGNFWVTEKLKALKHVQGLWFGSVD